MDDLSDTKENFAFLAVNNSNNTFCGKFQIKTNTTITIILYKGTISSFTLTSFSHQAANV